MPTTAELVWLLAGVANGDPSAFERLYAGTSAKLYGIVLRILHRTELAGAVLQDAYAIIKASAGNFDPGFAAPLPWMVAIARNRAIDIVRGEGAEAIEADGEAQIAAEHPSDEKPDINDELKRLLGCLGRLQPDLQRMVLLAYYSGQSREDLAREFGLPVSEIKARLHKALADIRVCIDA